MARIALIADIHGNLTALDAVLADLESLGADQVICLGDVAATGPQPRETITRLRALGCAVVMGNTDAASIRPTQSVPGDEDGRRIAEIDAWGTAQLTPADLAYLRTFQPTVTQPLGGEDTLLCFHGSPRSNTESIEATTSDAALTRMLRGYSATVLAGGHTHAPFVRRYGESILLNSGSVGLPYEAIEAGGRNPPWAEYAIIEWQAGALSVMLRRVPIDVTKVVRAAWRSGMPHAEWWARDWR